MIRVRHVEPVDRESWIALRTRLWPDGGDTHAAEVSAFFAGTAARPGADPEAVLVAVDDEHPRKILGFAELSRRVYAEGCDTTPVGFLEGWYVVPERREQGIGRELVLAGEAWARAQGCREFASDALAENAVSAAAHRALGFEEVGLLRCFRKDLAR
jgi:aminoglycoside 6'-N-acetyltransferase I